MFAKLSHDISAGARTHMHVACKAAMEASFSYMFLRVCRKVLRLWPPAKSCNHQRFAKLKTFDSMQLRTALDTIELGVAAEHGVVRVFVRTRRTSAEPRSGGKELRMEV
jgi:hypothetical protein